MGTGLSFTLITSRHGTERGGFSGGEVATVVDKVDFDWIGGGI